MNLGLCRNQQAEAITLASLVTLATRTRRCLCIARWQSYHKTNSPTVGSTDHHHWIQQDLWTIATIPASKFIVFDSSLSFTTNRYDLIICSCNARLHMCLILRCSVLTLAFELLNRLWDQEAATAMIAANFTVQVLEWIAWYSLVLLGNSMDLFLWQKSGIFPT